MMTRISSVITQFTLLLSAVGGAPAVFRVSASFFWSQPSTLASPMLVTTLPGSPGIEVNERPCLVRKSLTRSQLENSLHGPTKRWNLQSAGLAATLILVFWENCSSAGLT